jgi:hypothetical protein
MFLIVIYLNIANAASVASANMEQSDQKRYFAPSLERFGIDPNYLLSSHSYYNDNASKDAMLYKKRQLKKKWAKLGQGSQSPFTIAFPALIRTRRWIEQEQ